MAHAAKTIVQRLVEDDKVPQLPGLSQFVLDNLDKVRALCAKVEAQNVSDDGYESIYELVANGFKGFNNMSADELLDGIYWVDDQESFEQFKKDVLDET